MCTKDESSKPQPNTYTKAQFIDDMASCIEKANGSEISMEEMIGLITLVQSAAIQAYHIALQFDTDKERG